MPGTAGGRQGLSTTRSWRRSFRCDGLLCCVRGWVCLEEPVELAGAIKHSRVGPLGQAAPTGRQRAVAELLCVLADETAREWAYDALEWSCLSLASL
jgi:hypothetical protein